MGLKTISGAGWLKDLNDNISSLDARGAYTCVTADDTAGTVDIDTGLATADVCIVQIYRSGVQLFLDQEVSISAGVITVADGSGTGATFAVTAGDLVVYWAFPSS